MAIDLQTLSIAVGKSQVGFGISKEAVVRVLRQLAKDLEESKYCISKFESYDVVQIQEFYEMKLTLTLHDTPGAVDGTSTS